jgi:hypothetical protein
VKNIVNQLRFLTAFLLVSLLLIMVPPANLYKTQAENSNSSSADEGVFSIFHITDTQTLTNAASRTFLFDQQSQWIINNSAYFNNKMVIHTGDIQDNGNVIDQWINANKSMSLLMKNAIPYLWCAGNHDLNPMDTSNSQWLGRNYAAFNTSNFNTQTYWVSNFSDGKNTATKFSYTHNDQIYNFLFVALEYNANSTVLTWMKNLIKSYPDYNVIFGTHDYMNTDGTYTSYGASLSPVLDTLPNIVMVLNGHMHNSTNPSQTAHKIVNGRGEIQWDLQDYDINGIGSADVQILTFNLTSTSPTIYVSTFQTYAPSKYLTDNGHTYNFTLNLQRTPIPTLLPSPAPSPSTTPPSTPTPTTSPSSEPSPSPSPTITTSPTPTDIPIPNSMSFPIFSPDSTTATGATSTPTPAKTSKTTMVAPLSNPILTPSPTTFSTKTNTGVTVDLTINGNTTTQISSYKIAVNQSADSTTLSFTSKGESDITSFENITIPKSAVTYGISPIIFINNQSTINQGYNQDNNNYYVWYATHISRPEVSIVFTGNSISPTPATSHNPNETESLPQEAIYSVVIAAVIVAISTVLIVLRKHGNNKS